MVSIESILLKQNPQHYWCTVPREYSIISVSSLSAPSSFQNKFENRQRHVPVGYYLVSADLDFAFINKRLSDYYFENVSFWQIVHERNTNLLRITNLMERLKIFNSPEDKRKYFSSENTHTFIHKDIEVGIFDERYFPELWVMMVNRIIPSANIKLEEFSPIYW